MGQARAGGAVAGRGRVLVTGATGYIGGRLVGRLLAAGYTVRCLARAPRKLAARDWADDPRVEVVRADAGERAGVEAALRGCDAAYYLIHSMATTGSRYREHDRELARNFGAAARAAGVGRIIYLGGLGETGAALSEHLASRREVEAALAADGVPVTVFRAAMIIGSGSASFEILRYLVERLPVMVTPRWVHTEAQPIAVRNVLHYLVACLDEPATIGRTLDIGGPDVMTYRQMMQIMAAALGLGRRWVFPVPVLTPRLSSLWIHMVTPISHRIARPLAEGLRNRVVCRDGAADRLMPQRLLTVAESIDAALGRLEAQRVETAWSGAGPIPGDPDWAGGRTFVDRRTEVMGASADRVYRAVCRLGGGQGYYAADWLWRLRGWLDRLVGGPGLRRGRRDPDRVAYGEALDFWRVTGVEPRRMLELRAEMKLPGEATLTFEIEERVEGGCVLTQTARFKPKGLWGLAYWYAVAPLHGIVFSGMLAGIRRAAEAPAGSAAGGRAAARAAGPVVGEEA
ncbi:MAG TPA: SDR family oxidoreductase [Phycisphaerae bacterium]|nr:SDR family oxidoreductase [Phycisphaerae bacterium]